LVDFVIMNFLLTQQILAVAKIIVQINSLLDLHARFRLRPARIIWSPMLFGGFALFGALDIAIGLGSFAC